MNVSYYDFITDKTGGDKNSKIPVDFLNLYF